MRAWISIALAVVLALAVAFFVTANLETVNVHLPGVTLQEPLWLAMIIAGVTGAVLALAACGVVILRLKIEARRQTRRIGELEQEVHGLRTLPIAGDTAVSTSAPRT